MNETDTNNDDRWSVSMPTSTRMPHATFIVAPLGDRCQRR